MLWFWPQGKAYACGISLSEPRSFYDGVDFQGHVHLIEKLGDLQVGEVNLPIYLILNSGDGYESPYSGVFDIPLLSSRMEQVDENTFLLRSPTGWFLPFVRHRRDKNILDGSSGMKALIDDAKGTITVWAECGSKAVFSRGRIVELQIKDAKLTYVYSGDRVSEIREGGNTLLKVNSDSKTGEVSGLSLGLKQDINFSWGQRPIVQSIQGRQVISGMQKTLAKIALPNGTEKIFEFAVDDQMQPTLKIDGKQEISWNPETRLANKVGDWTYTIEPPKDRFANAAISRSNGKGTESWFHDGRKGEETIISLDGTKQVKTWFTTGVLANKIRKLSIMEPGGKNRLTTFGYNENGDLLRKQFSAPDTSEVETYSSISHLGESIQKQTIQSNRGEIVILTLPNEQTVMISR